MISLCTWHSASGKAPLIPRAGTLSDHVNRILVLDIIYKEYTAGWPNANRKQCEGGLETMTAPNFIIRLVSLTLLGSY